MNLKFIYTWLVQFSTSIHRVTFKIAHTSYIYFKYILNMRIKKTWIKNTSPPGVIYSFIYHYNWTFLPIISNKLTTLKIFLELLFYNHYILLLNLFFEEEHLSCSLTFSQYNEILQRIKYNFPDLCSYRFGAKKSQDLFIKPKNLIGSNNFF